ncbi:MAG: methyltransferase [Hyphomonadaceae bacterium]|nr:methyltransferase [Hyphomonadaceae bacterium]
MDAQILAFIKANLPVLAVPSVPGIRLHKASPTSGLWRLAQADDAFEAPYWAHWWGGGVALARHVLDHPAVVADRRVIDLGCGNGIVGIAAMLAGARAVTAIDIDRYAVAVTQLNAALNGVSLTSLQRDVLDDQPPEADIILVGDLFYDQDLAERVTASLDRCLTAGIDVLVGDPGRAALPRARLRLLAEYPGVDFGGLSAAPDKKNAVFAFVAAPG